VILEGVLCLDKPAGPTSHDLVARARRLLGQPRSGLVSLGVASALYLAGAPATAEVAD